MPKTRIAPVETWPDLRLTLHVWPWCWKLRPRFYVDYEDGWRGHSSFTWLFFAVKWWGNKRMFTLTVETSAELVTKLQDTQ